MKKIFSNFKTTPTKIFWLLFILNLFNYIDRQILYSVFPLLKHDLNLTDTQLGSIASAFMLVYLLYAPVAGFFADRGSRPRWMGASAMLWSAATMASAFVGSYTSLLAARSFIGIGEGGFTSIAQGFLIDRYPANRRARILAAFGLALPLGGALGYLIGGVVGEHFGWRAAFMLVGVPGMLLGLRAFFLADERTERGVEKPGLASYFHLFSNKRYLFICLAQAMVTFVTGGLAAWLPSYFHREFALSAAQAGTLFGVTVIIAGAAGTYAGGQAAERLFKNTKDPYILTGFLGILLAIPFAAAGLAAHSLAPAVLFLGIAIMFAFTQLGPLNAAIAAATDCNVRSMAFALNIFIIHALGDALSPVVIGKFSDMWGLKEAIFVSAGFLLPACFFLYAASRYPQMQTQEKCES